MASCGSRLRAGGRTLRGSTTHPATQRLSLTTADASYRGLLQADLAGIGQAHLTDSPIRSDAAPTRRVRSWSDCPIINSITSSSSTGRRLPCRRHHHHRARLPPGRIPGDHHRHSISAANRTAAMMQGISPSRNPRNPSPLCGCVPPRGGKHRRRARRSNRES